MSGIKQLARELNLSISTVSRALNGSPEASAETKELVAKAASKLGYVPNQSGRSLRRGATGALGFMVHTGPNTPGRGDSFFLEVFDGVQSVVARHNLDLVALLCGRGQNPFEYLQRMVTRGFVDGVILSHTDRHDPRIEMLARRGVPFVTMGRSLTDVGQSWVDSDMEAAASVAIDRLVGRGHTRVAITLPDDDINIGHIFHQGVIEALARHGLRLDPSLVFRIATSESAGYEVGKRLVKRQPGPTAILLSHESLTTGLYRALDDGGVAPGRDMAVIGFSSAHSGFLTPKLTGFEQDPHQVGIDLGEALLGRMPHLGNDYPAIVRKKWPLTLVDGESDGWAKT